MLARFEKKKRTQTPVALSNSPRRSVQNTLCPPAQPPLQLPSQKIEVKKENFHSSWLKRIIKVSYEKYWICEYIEWLQFPELIGMDQ